MNAPALPLPWLLADIGGTNARFGWVGEPDMPVARVRVLRTADHADPAAAARAYLDALAAELGSGHAAPRAAAFAVATAVGADRIAFTNSAWSFSRRDTERALGLQRLIVLNDFEALALALPRLHGPQLRAVGPDTPAAPDAARAVIGPGTGLGVGGLLPHAGQWVALPGEGGHATLAAADDFESAVIAAARRMHGHVSAERLLSGMGLALLERALAEVLGAAPPGRDAPQIVAAALAGGDALAERSVQQFCAFLGGFAGDVALTLGARGGVYIGGGIVPRLGALFERSAFRARFEAKGRFEAYLRAIPTWLIVDTLAALAGAAARLAQERG
ncbi:MAG: glucokinase [Rubrivivax sp.]